MKHFTLAFIVLFLATGGFAQTSQPVKEADPTAAITALRSSLVDSFNKGDLDRLLSHLAPDVVITWQNGEICRGPEQVRTYYNKMMNGPDKIVASVHSDPQVTDRKVYGDWAVSWGVMNDHFKLTDGRDLKMDSKFTATIARIGEEWKVTSFHLSVNAFDNSILSLAMSKTATWTGIAAGAIALILGIIVGRMGRRKPVGA